MIAALRQNTGKDLSEHMPVGFSAWLKFRVEAIDEGGTMRLSFVVREDMLNPFGILHGGVLSSMLDESMGFQLFLLSPNDEQYVALNLQCDFLRPSKPGQMLFFSPKLMRRGRKTAYMHCQVEDEQGRLVAHASSNFMRL